jgi:thioredoxin 1
VDLKISGRLHRRSKVNQSKIKNIIRVVVLACIITVVTGIWVIKNNEAVELTISANPDFDLHVSESLDLEHLKSYGLPMIIDFGADDCPPCKEMAPALAELNEELQGKAIIKFLDVWEDPKLSEGYPIRAIPTQFFFDAEGKAFVPEAFNEKPLRMVTSSETGEHLFTIHEGGLTKEQMMAILSEMGVE